MATINYKGMELEEITTPQIFDPPQEMLVWDDDSDEPKIDKVWGIAPKSAREELPIAAANSCWKHCALLPDPPKPRRATNRELAKWLAQGKGEGSNSAVSFIHHTFVIGAEDEGCDGYGCTKVRKWDDTEWHEPTVDYMFGGDDAEV